MRHVATLVLLCLCAPVVQAACPPAGYDAQRLQTLKSSGFSLEYATARRTLALGLVDCLADPDPALRDGIAYEALSTWMRAKAFDAPALRDLRTRSYELLEGDDPDGFGKPFAALVLSEVARTDRIAPWMSVDERAAMVGRATAYVASVDDYRGFVDGQGWRHGVAHGADWLMQLALNPALDRAQLEATLAAVATQAVPTAGHAYVFGEGARLARPVLFVAARGVLSPEEWAAWFTALRARLGPMPPGGDAAWLARHHDLQGFLDSLYVAADQSKDPAVQALKPHVAAALNAGA